MYMHTIVWWCSHMHYDVYLMMMMYKRCTLRWWWCIPYDYDAYPVTTMHTYDDDAWWCMPCVQWKQSIITCLVIVYDEVYNDVHEQCMAVKWLVGIQGWFGIDQSAEVISSRFIAWYRLVQLSRIGTGCLMCSWIDSDWPSQMIDLYSVIGQVIGSGVV